jgi:hypothetical protein
LLIINHHETTPGSHPRETVEGRNTGSQRICIRDPWLGPVEDDGEDERFCPARLSTTTAGTRALGCWNGSTRSEGAGK